MTAAELAQPIRAHLDGHPRAHAALNVLVARCNQRDRLRQAVIEDAIYLMSTMEARHGDPQGDDCPRCKSDRRELERMQEALDA